MAFITVRPVVTLGVMPVTFTVTGAFEVDGAVGALAGLNPVITVPDI